MTSTHICKTILLVLTILFVSQALYAQQLAVDWRIEPGPRGGFFTDIVEDPHSERLWAIVNDNVYYSDDFGESWAARNIPADWRSSIAFREDGAIFIDRYRTYDQGETWEKMALPDSLDLRGMHLDAPTGHLVANTMSGFYVSEDEGDSWMLRFPFMYGDLESHTSGLLFARGYDDETSILSRLILSVDGGMSWNELEKPLDKDWDVYIAPGGQLYVIGEDDDTPQIYRSPDQGETWELVFEENRDAAECIQGFSQIIDINKEEDILFAGEGTLLSLANGTCTSLQLNLPEEFEADGSLHEAKARVFTLVPVRNGRMFAYSSYNQLYRSDDNGVSWKTLSMDGVVESEIFPLYVDPSGEYMLAKNRHGLYFKEIQSAEWSYLGFSVDRVYQILDGPEPGELWMLTDKWIMATDDEGTSWRVLADLREITDTEYHEVRSILYDGERGIHYFYQESKIYFSLDGAQSWSSITVPQDNQLVGTVHGLAVTPEGDLMAYLRHNLSGREGVWLAKDLGQTWEFLARTFFGSPGVFFDSSGQSWMYSNNEIWVSLDDGNTWERAPFDYSSTYRLYTMVETPDGSLWLNHAVGLYRSIDRGGSWHEQFPDRRLDVLSMVWDEEGEELILGTSDGDIYRGFIDTSIRVDVEPIPDSEVGFSLGVYPNPVVGTAHIHFSITKSASVTLEVYDPLGRQVVQLLDWFVEAGKHEVPFEAGDLAPGLYMYRLQASEGVKTGAFVLVE